MRRQYLSTVLLVCGMLLLASGMSALMPGMAHAQQGPVAAPSPRPTLPSDDDGAATPPDRSRIPGHIGGTVIDVFSGAPVPGMPVWVGNTIVVTDQNGNYGIWVLPGSYLVNVAPSAGQGTTVDGPSTVVVGPETSVVQHLRVALPQPATPVAAVAERPAPAPVQEEVVIPVSLPRTGDGRAVDVWLWMSLGILCIGAGLGLSVLSARSRRSD